MLIAVPWALLKLGAFLPLVRYGLRRVARPGRSTLLEESAGRFPARRIWPLALLPATAIAVYAIRAVTQSGSRRNAPSSALSPSLSRFGAERERKGLSSGSHLSSRTLRL